MTDIPPAELYSLIRRHEPVLRYTDGELFFPLSAADYLSRASLWLAEERGRSTLVVDHGELDEQRLAEASRDNRQGRLFLRYAPSALSRSDLKKWRRRPDRPRFKGASRLAAVGLLGRFIDMGMRLSLTLRGKVPGGLTAAAQIQYAAGNTDFAYHAHVLLDGGYLAIQYWFLYAMNDWRSSFSGVNDHESDWEQVTLFLVPDESAPEGWTPAWIAFSSHDEAGDDLRRRLDDPDITWVEGTHPVVNVGAGSHSGAYLPGDYLVRVQPPSLARLFSILTSVRSALFAWTRGRPNLGVGIPYVDYRRGDGIGIGPGSATPWRAIIIDDDTPWVRDFRGLWGLDTEDPFGGERAPAGPRYERNGTLRVSWADPVGWAGLDKVPPTPQVRAEIRIARLAELDTEIERLSTEIESGRADLRREAAGINELAPRTARAQRGQLSTHEEALSLLQSRRRQATNERDALRHGHVTDVDPPAHAHLKHRAEPETTTPPGALLRFWSGASLSILLALFGLALLFRVGPLPWIILGAVGIVMAVEALLRRRMMTFLLSVAILAGLGGLVWLFLTHLRVAFGVLALIASVAIGLANLRGVLASSHRE